jgi:methylenetetrahydrofolate dehydrogenase (NADP+) / methenyltetrahydrofolate cyclohydrolase
VHAVSLRSLTLQRARSFFQAQGRRPRLDVIIVGDHPASRSYVSTKTKQAVETEIDGRLIELLESIDQGTLIEEIRKLNAATEVDGILVQLPLPPHLDSAITPGATHLQLRLPRRAASLPKPLRYL